MKKVDVNSVDLKRLHDTFTEMNNDKGDFGLALLAEISFQKETLEKMRASIKQDSLKSEYNGYVRSNPIIAGYNAMVNNYSKLIRQAVDLLPKDYSSNDDDSLDNWE